MISISSYNSVGVKQRRAVWGVREESFDSDKFFVDASIKGLDRAESRLQGGLLKRRSSGTSDIIPASGAGTGGAMGDAGRVESTPSLRASESAELVGGLFEINLDQFSKIFSGAPRENP